MKLFLQSTLAAAFYSLLLSCSGQSQSPPAQKTTKIVGGGCDGCELMYVGMPKEINATDTSAGWNEAGQKLVVSGTVFQLDGKTPAADVIIYYWQTDNDGYYSPRPGLPKEVEQHGHIRGWVKTGEDGKYTIYTVRPSPYPGEEFAAHIHLSIKEPDIANEYYTDEINFAGDKFLKAQHEKIKPENRGGSGIVTVKQQGDLQTAEHNIILGLNIPDYPEK